MTAIIFWAVLFSLATSASILFLGNRELIAGEIGLSRLVKIIFDWRFIAGAVLAFAARILFVMTNNAVYKIPELAESSTTITTLINSGAVIVVVLMNYYWLGERLSVVQGVGAFLILAGAFLLLRVH